MDYPILIECLYVAVVKIISATLIMFGFKNIELGVSATVIKPPSLDPEFISAIIESITSLCLIDVIVRSTFSYSSSTKELVILGEKYNLKVVFPVGSAPSKDSAGYSIDSPTAFGGLVPFAKYKNLPNTNIYFYSIKTTSCDLMIL